MSGPPRLVNLTHLYFQVTKAVDNGRVAAMKDIREAVHDGRVMELLDQYEEIDLSGYKDYEELDIDNLSEDNRPQGWDWDEMNAMFQRYASADPHDLGVDNNGLLYLLAEVVQLIQGSGWNHPNITHDFDNWDLEIEQDW